MPPKSKKEQEEEAQRLAEEQRKKEQEEARLALERQKYAAETIDTGLLLPASNQLIMDLYSQPLSFIHEKLEEVLKDLYPALSNYSSLKNLFINEIINYLVQGGKIFGIQKKQLASNQQNFLKVRVLAGIALKLMANEHPAFDGHGKNKKSDEKLFKQLLVKHVQEGEGRLKIFNSTEVPQVLNCINRGYFRHFLVLWNYTSFEKRSSQTQQRIYISSPSTFFNVKSTTFLDLSERKSSQQEAKKQE